jgi:hypothetical protein
MLEPYRNRLPSSLPPTRAEPPPSSGKATVAVSVVYHAALTVRVSGKSPA